MITICIFVIEWNLFQTQGNSEKSFTRIMISLSSRTSYFRVTKKLGSEAGCTSGGRESKKHLVSGYSTLNIVYTSQPWILAWMTSETIHISSIWRTILRYVINAFQQETYLNESVLICRSRKSVGKWHVCEKQILPITPTLRILAFRSKGSKDIRRASTV